VLPHHECVVEPLQDVADPAAVESATEPLHSAADPTGSGAALTEKFCLCVWF
jgi:hypothetical protein